MSGLFAVACVLSILLGLVAVVMQEEARIFVASGGGVMT